MLVEFWVVLLSSEIIWTKVNTKNHFSDQRAFRAVLLLELLHAVC